MPVSKNQMKRLMRIVAELRLKKYPNAKSLADKFTKDTIYDYDSGMDVVSEKTLQRDFKLLKEMFKAPIMFDRASNGYYLASEGWIFESPILKDASVTAAVLGIKICSSIMPKSEYSSKMEDAVNDILSSNNAEFVDSAYIESVIAASGVKVHIDPAVFTNVFQAWEGRNTLRILYKNVKGCETEMRVDPHAIVYYNSAWYIKGEKPADSQVIILALHRILKAELLPTVFTLNKSIVDSVKNGKLFEFTELHDVKVKCLPAIAPYIREQYEQRGETIKEESDGSIILSIKSISKIELLRWILAEGGKAILISPENFRNELKEAAQSILDAHK